MLRILRWTVLGLLLVAVAAPAVQAQGGGIGMVTAASSADLDPDGAPSASAAAPDPTTALVTRIRPGQIREPVIAAERSAVRDGELSLRVEAVVEMLLHWFLL